MPVIELGRRPELARLQLWSGDGFFTEIQLTAEDDAYTVAPALVFPLPAPAGEARWTAELVSPTLARFTATEEQVAEVIAESTDRQFQVEYDGLAWYAGRFEVLND